MTAQLTSAEHEGFQKRNVMRLIYWAVPACLAVALNIVAPTISTRAAATLFGGSVVLIWVAISFLRAKFHFVVLTWLTVFPFCYYFLSYPRERSVFTVDRAFIILVVIEVLILSHRNTGTPIIRDIKLAAWLWTAYCAACLVSVAGHPVLDILGSYRLIVDGVVLPAVLGFYAIRCFPIFRNMLKLHACLCILMIAVATVTAIELITGSNLLPAVGAVDEWVHTQAFKIIRVDGPFENSGVLCLVGTLGFFLLVYLGRLVGSRFSRIQSSLHKMGIWASLGCAFMPMNRGLVIALIVCAAVDYLSRSPLIPRATWNWIIAVLAFFGVFSWIFYPGVFEDRVSRADNVYQRIAQDRQTLEVISDHPVFGVGFNLYHDTVQGDPRYAVRWQGFEAMDFPHNSAFAVLAEEGCVGFVLYVGAQIFFVLAMWRLRKFNEMGWRVFLYCTLVYTIYGLDVGMAYYSDLNLFYMFVLGIVVQIQLCIFAAERHLNEPLHG
jgi:hypothetical protein